MGKFLALIMLAAMALFIAGPAMAEHDGWHVDKSYTFDKDNTVTGNTNINVDKDIDIDVDGDLEATGGLEVQGDVVFKELDVQVQDEEVVSKFFELDDSATSRWTIVGEGVMNASEQLQNGDGNVGIIDQNNPLDPDRNIFDQMNVALQYQIGTVNVASIAQASAAFEPGTPSNNFAKQIQIGNGNIADVLQNIGEVPPFVVP